MLVIIIVILHGLGRLTCSGIDTLPSFPGASTISSSSGFVVEGVFREFGVVHSFKVVDPNLFVFGVDKKNQLDVTFCILYFSSNSCSTCFGQPCAHHQQLTTA